MTRKPRRNEHQTRHRPDIAHMRLALSLARQACEEGDWPVAAVISRGDEILVTGRGRQNTSANPTAHAETDALSAAVKAGLDLRGATLTCTMEPCPMCAHALHLHGIRRIVLGARHADLGRTDMGHYSLEKLAEMAGYDFTITNDVLREECIAMRVAWGRDVT